VGESGEKFTMSVSNHPMVLTAKEQPINTQEQNYEPYDKETGPS